MRPEKIAVDEEIESGMVTVEGTIVERVYVGTSTQIIVELAPGLRLMALEQNWIRARSDDRWEIGQRARLAARARPRASLRWSNSAFWVQGPQADRHPLGGTRGRGAGTVWSGCGARCSSSPRRRPARRRTSSSLDNLPEVKDATAINFMSYGHGATKREVMLVTGRFGLKSYSLQNPADPRLLDELTAEELRG